MPFLRRRDRASDSNSTKSRKPNSYASSNATTRSYAGSGRPFRDSIDPLAELTARVAVWEADARTLDEERTARLQKRAEEKMESEQDRVRLLEYQQREAERKAAKDLKRRQKQEELEQVKHKVGKFFRGEYFGNTLREARGDGSKLKGMVNGGGDSRASIGDGNDKASVKLAGKRESGDSDETFKQK